MKRIAVQHSPRRKLRAVLFGVIAAFGAVGALVVPAAATVVATDTMLPHWQGTSRSAPAVGHQIDCTNNLTTNPQWPSGCTLTMHTVITGANCYQETIGNPLSGLGGTNNFSSTPCQVSITATVVPNSAAGTADCGYTVQDAQISWQSGVNSTVFQGSGFPLVMALNEVRTSKMYLLSAASTPNSQSLTHQLVFHDHFVANFNSTQCPGDSRQQGGVLVSTVKANLYDPAVDLAVDGSAGYLQDNVVSP